jgi:D-glycerate 3-kinase
MLNPKFEKALLCSSFIIKQLRLHKPSSRPLFVGFNGVQGVGKTTLVSQLLEILTTFHHLKVVVLSIDDLYLTHADQTSLASQFKENPLLQHRGVPGTHDLELAKKVVLESLLHGKATKIPIYDKSLFNGQGDRLPESEWQTSEANPDVILLEGWCVGFQAIPDSDVVSLSSQTKYDSSFLLQMNEFLKGYNELFSKIDAMVHISALDLKNVYKWRQQQELDLHRAKGKGMTPEQVDKFVDGYWPAYVLYTDGVGRGLKEGALLKITVGDQRETVESVTI